MNTLLVIYLTLFTYPLISVNLVPELTPATFDKLTNKKEGSTMVMFYAPWCPHCQTAKPHFQKAASKMSEVNKSNSFAFMNCDDSKNQNLCTTQKIEGYPTIKLFSPNNVTHLFNNEVTEDNLLRFFSDPVQGADSMPSEEETPDVALKHTPYLIADNFKSTLSKTAHALIFFYAPWCPHCQDSKPMVDSASEKLSAKDRKLFAVNCEDKNNKKLCDDEKVEGFPTIRYYHFGELYAEYDDRMEAESFLKYLSKPPKEKVPIPAPQSETTEEDAAEDSKLEHVHQMSHHDFDAHLKSHDSNLMVMFYVPMCSHCKEAKPVYDAAAGEIQKTKTKIIFGAINCNDKLNENLCRKQKVSAYPTFIHYFKGKRLNEYTDHPITKEKLILYFSKKMKDEL